MKKVFIIMVLVIILMVAMTCVAYAADGTEDGTPDFWSFITEKAYVLVPVLYVIGMVIKKIPNIPNWLIPIALLIIAVPLAMALAGWNIEGAIQGILVAGVTVFANQLYKQTYVKTE